jgi:hypothetical protein
MQICLKCAREEYRMDKVECDCGGRLWIPKHVGGKFGNNNIDEAAKLILAGKKPWEEQS